jgi:polyisoprenoid-binding protein YceI
MKQAKDIILGFLIIFFLTGSAFHFITLQSWQIEEGYLISFSSSDASGVFNDFKGNIVFDEQNLSASRFDVTINVVSINTGNGLKNRIAKSDEWFDALKYPMIRYVSKNITRAGSSYLVNGTLEMHGICRAVIIPFSFKRISNRAVFEGTFNVNRNDYRIGKPGGELVELIKIEVKVPVTEAKRTSSEN